MASQSQHSVVRSPVIPQESRHGCDGRSPDEGEPGEERGPQLQMDREGEKLV